MDLLYLDKQIFFLINRGFTHPFLDALMTFLSAHGYVLVFPFYMYMLWSATKDGPKQSGFNLSAALQIGAVAICSVFLSDWVGNEFKNGLMRVRPCNALENVRLLVGCTSSGSLPSNHAANSFAYAIPLFYMTRNHINLPLRSYPLVLAISVALSRVYVGVHYPGDILAGALLGTSVSCVVIIFHKFAAQRYKTSPEITLLAVVLTALSIFRIFYILHGPLDLSPDEAHYWEWSRRLDLSYYSKGPLIAYLIYIGTSLFGNNVFGIRIMAVIFSTLSSIYIFELVNLMHDSRPHSVPQKFASLLSALAFQAIPLFATFGILFTIDSPFIFFWIISLYYFYKAISEHWEKQWTYWILLGISIGCGLLTKYTMAFFPLCGLLLLAFSEKKYLLRTPMPYVAIIVSMVIFSPAIFWNWSHRWVTLRHTAGQAHVADGITLSLRSFLEFLGSQIGIVTPIFFCLMIYALIKSFLSDRSYQSKFLFFFSIPVIAFFLLKACQGKVQANWAMFGYITGIVAVVRYCLDDYSRKKGVFLAASIILAFVLTVISHYPLIIGLPQKLDPSARLRGWKIVGKEVGRLAEQLAPQGYYLLFSDSYQNSSELAFYVPRHPETFCINLGRRMNQYDFWPDVNERAAKLRLLESSVPGAGINGIFVKTGNTDMPPAVANAFAHYTKNVFRVIEHGSILREYSIFICYNFSNLKNEKPESF